LTRAGANGSVRTVTAPPETADAVVIGAGPSGLGAALSMARAGARPVVLDAGPTVGGLCVTRRHGDFAYDVGGHIPFVNDPERLEYLRDLLGERLRWVDRPVACVRAGRIVPGRYLDQRPAGAIVPAAEDGSALGALGARFGTAFVDEAQRPYLEKVDGLPLERVVPDRPLRLLLEQAAPEGFWFPAGGIGELMDAMRDAIEAAGGLVLTDSPVTGIETRSGRVRGVEATIGGERHEIATDDVVVAVPAGMAARMLRPTPPPEATPPVRMRAVCVVYLALPVPRVTPEAWIQVDDPDAPFARIFESRNWSPELAPPERTVMGCECYCDPSEDDPVWSLDDADLSARCARALAEPLGWASPDVADEATLLEVLRIRNAYPSPDRMQAAEVAAPTRWLGRIGGMHLARGSAVIDAIDAGERAAATIVAGAPTLAPTR
jgi:protoporphyrinogen oxidase